MIAGAMRSSLCHSPPNLFGPSVLESGEGSIDWYPRGEVDSSCGDQTIGFSLKKVGTNDRSSFFFGNTNPVQATPERYLNQ